MSNVTVIDAKRGLRPRLQADDAEVAARLKALQEKAKGRDAHGILEQRKRLCEVPRAKDFRTLN